MPYPAVVERHVNIKAADLEVFVVCGSQRHLVTAASANDATIDFVGHCSFRRQKLASLRLKTQEIQMSDEKEVKLVVPMSLLVVP